MADRLLFSYASADDPAFKRIAIQTIERLTGQRRLKRLYLENQRRPRLGESFWDAAVRQLELRVDCDPERLQAIPAIGPVVVVANHPFGVVDGLVIGHLILTHSLLCRAIELQPYLLPIDFAETPTARATNLRSRAEALSWLCGGGALVVFPGGAVSTAEGPFARRAVDPEWKLFTAKAIAHARATVVPIFFAGQNSRLFQVASHVSLTLRLSLLFHEVRNKIGSAVEVRIGTPVPYSALSHLADRKALVGYLRRATYELAAQEAIAPLSIAPRPSRARGAPLRRIMGRLRRNRLREPPRA